MPRTRRRRSPPGPACVAREHRLQPRHGELGHELRRQRAGDDDDQQRGDQRRRLAPAGQQATQEGESLGHPGRVEEHPTQADELEGREALHQTRTGPSARREPAATPGAAAQVAEALAEALQRPQNTNVQAAPCHSPPRTMVIMMLRTVWASPRIAAERDVEVVAQPARQASCASGARSPAGCRRIGRVEVLWEAEAEQQGQPDGDVGVSAEVAVDLDGVAPTAKTLRRRVLRGRREDGRTIAVDTYDEMTTFLNSPAKISQKARGSRPARVAAPADLWQQLPAADDRPGQQVREEAE